MRSREPGQSQHRKGNRFHTVALAASAGGYKAIAEILRGLPVRFPATVFVLQHRSAAQPFFLPQLLAAQATMPVNLAEQGTRPRPGAVYVAPPGRHLVVRENGRLCVRRTEPVRHVRPSADLLFESVAAQHGQCAIAVVLSGMGSDGARGVRAVRESGGFVLAQDERSAKYFDMPRAAIETGRVDLVLPLRRMAFALTALVMGPEAAMRLHPDPGPVGRALRPS